MNYNYYTIEIPVMTQPETKNLQQATMFKKCKANTRKTTVAVNQSHISRTSIAISAGRGAVTWMFSSVNGWGKVSW